jgi:hypothetical protein
MRHCADEPLKVGGEQLLREQGDNDEANEERRSRAAADGRG